MALNTSLVAYWSLEEASGTRNDAAGANHLTDVNTVTSATGKVGNAASFAAASDERLTLTDNAAVSMGDIDFTIALWVNFASVSSYRMFLSKDDNGSNREYLIYRDTDGGRISFFVTSSGLGGTAVEIQCTTMGSTSASTWYFVVAWHDSVGNTINICINDGTPNSTSHSAGVFDGTAGFRLGSYGGGYPHDGLLDEVGIWKRVLTAAEITELYNGGSGRDYAYILSGGGGSVVTSIPAAISGVIRSRMATHLTR